MKIFDFVKKLLPSIERNQVLSDLRTLKELLENQTIPPHQSAVDAGAFPANKRFQDKWCLEFQKKFDLATRNLRVRSNYVEATLGILNTLPARVDWLMSQLEKETEATIVSSGITFPIVNLMQMHSAIAFVAKFSRKILLISYANEAKQYFKQRNGESPYTPAEVKEIEKSIDDYLRVLAVLGRPDLEKILAAVPDVVVDGSDASGTVNAYGPSRLQPLNFSLQYQQYPIYFIREYFAERQVAEYEEAKAEKLALELFLIQLQQAANGQQDASLQQQIEYHTNRLHRLSLKVEELGADLS